MPNKIYYTPETAITFKDSGGSAVLTLQNLGFGAGRISARYDRGAGAKPMRHRWTGAFQFETAPAIGETIEIYLSASDGAYADGTVGTSDAALTSDKRRNLKLIGTVVVDTTLTGTDIVRSGTCEIASRYISTGVWNASNGDNLKNTANTSMVILEPIPDEIQ